MRLGWATAQGSQHLLHCLAPSPKAGSLSPSSCVLILPTKVVFVLL